MVDMGGHEEVEDIALLGRQGGHGAEDALDEAAAVGAVGAEAAVARAERAVLLTNNVRDFPMDDITVVQLGSTAA